MLELVGDGWERVVDSGEQLRFGRGGGGVELVLADDPRLHRHCGTIEVDDAGWVLRNAGRWLRLRVIGLDRFGVDSMLPGQHLRVPWAEARVQVFAGERCHEFTARHTATPADGHDTTAAVDLAEESTEVPIRVDRDTGYFRALVALCEPQLLDPSTVTIASDLEIARRLNRSGTERSRLTGKSVERRLDNCRTRFGLKVVDDTGASVGLERRDSRRLLVEVALLTATVTPGDLRVLEPRHDGGHGDGEWGTDGMDRPVGG